MRSIVDAVKLENPMYGARASRVFAHRNVTGIKNSSPNQMETSHFSAIMLILLNTLLSEY